MSYKSARVGSDAWYQEKIDKKVLACRPGTGSCMFCGNKLVKDSKDSICKKCIEVKLR